MSYHFVIAECEQQYIDGVVETCRLEMKGKGHADREHRYRQMLWSHADVLVSDFQYQVRKPNGIWPFNPRTVFGDDIKYASVRYHVKQVHI